MVDWMHSLTCFFISLQSILTGILWKWISVLRNHTKPTWTLSAGYSIKITELIMRAYWNLIASALPRNPTGKTIHYISQVRYYFILTLYECVCVCVCVVTRDGTSWGCGLRRRPPDMESSHPSPFKKQLVTECYTVLWGSLLHGVN